MNTWNSNRITGPEIYAGLVKIDGYLMGVIGNRQGWLGEGYPEYADYPGIGGKLYRQGLIKMNEFVTLCGRDRVPIIWFQDTSPESMWAISPRRPNCWVWASP